MDKAENKTCRIFISAAEPSADAHCAGLISSLRQKDASIEFVGVGGPKMAEAGCKLLETTADRASMIYNAFRHVVSYFLLLRRINRFLQSEKVDLVVVCDSPAFNFHVAKAAKKAGKRTLFYVAPQLWAWGQWRIEKLKNCCDKLCCILPFEQQWFSKRGLEAVFVGNPLFDELEDDLGGFKKTYSDFELQNAKIALMPGSRDAEIRTLWPAMQQIAVRLRKKYPNIEVTTVAVDDDKKKVLRSMQVLGFRCHYTIGPVTEAAAEADFSIVASGSATLQIAAAGCPMVVMYQSSRLLWHIVGRWIVKTRYLSLVNILAERRLVPEYMPYFKSVEPIAKEIEQLLQDKGSLAELSGRLIDLAGSLRKGKACEEVCGIVMEMTGA